jgi:hypothetical protein
VKSAPSYERTTSACLGRFEDSRPAKRPSDGRRGRVILLPRANGPNAPVECHGLRCVYILRSARYYPGAMLADIARIMPLALQRNRHKLLRGQRCFVVLSASTRDSPRAVLTVPIVIAVALLASRAGARPRCEPGQIYRPSMGICQSKASRSARPYVLKARAVPKHSFRERVIIKEVVREKAPEPLSTIPLPEPTAQGSLNPLPRWRSKL